MKFVLPALLSLSLLTGTALCQQKNSKRQKELERELSLDPDPKKLKKDQRPQVLELPKEPPQAVAVDTQKLVFHLSPLSNKGLLSQQVRDGLRALDGSARGAAIVKIRAFVAGTGDMRRVQTIVSETFDERRQPLPALSVIQVGQLPLEGAQVVMEAISVDRKSVTPNGIAFIAAQPSTARDAAGPLKTLLASSSLDAAGVRRVTCFLSSLEHVDQVRSQIASAFPDASANFVQLRRDSGGDFAACEAVAALPETQSKAPHRADVGAQVVQLGPGKIVLSGTQMAFGEEDRDLRLAFGRLDKALESAGTDMKLVVFTRVYALTRSAEERIARIRTDYFDKAAAPVTTSLIFEGLPSLDASVGLDVVAVSK
jgi:enamine deaminase RidA (YjgF/YER057c/UK114 family)